MVLVEGIPVNSVIPCMRMLGRQAVYMHFYHTRCSCSKLGGEIDGETIAHSVECCYAEL